MAVENEIQEIRALVAELTSRIYRLEQKIGLPQPIARTTVQAQPEQPATPPPPPVERRPAETPAGPLLSYGVHTAAEAEPSLESRIGSRWLNRIGIIAVLIGVSYFLKYAFENNWIGPAGRIAIGLFAGIGVLLWSERFRRNSIAFSYSLKAVGIGTLYLSLWAGFQMYKLFPAEVAFGAMILVTATTAILALAQNAEILAALAIVGGFITPILLSTGQNREITLFSYVALLDLAVLVLIAFRPWTRLLVGSFIGTLVLYVGWNIDYYSRPQLSTTLLFVTIFFTIFAVAPVVAGLRSKELRTQPSRVLLFIPLVNAALYFLAVYVLLESTHKSALAWIALALAAVYLLLSRQIQKERIANEADSRVLSLLHLALAVGFLTTAIPLKLETHWITIGWFIEAAALLWVGYRTSSNFLKVLATVALVLGVWRLLFFDNFTPEHLVLNARFATYMVAIAVLALGVSLAGKSASEFERKIASIAVIAINLLALVAITWEINDYFGRQLSALASRYRNQILPWSEHRQINIARDFAYSAAWMIYGAALIFVGFWKRSAFLRWQALVLIAVTIGKVFIYDTSQLERGYRIISFIALGVLLLAVSFIYQRDWLKLSRRPGA